METGVMTETILLVHDTRLAITLPNPTYNLVYEVGENVPLSQLVTWLSTQASANKSSFVRWRLWAHGYEPVGSQGGAGIQVCTEGLTIHTFDQLSAINGLVDWIDIQGCGAAYITPGSDGKDGDGNYFCYRLAQITGASVRASTSTMHVWEPVGDSGVVGMHIPWEGVVLTYGPTGAVVKSENFGPLDPSPSRADLNRRL
jgi:hypothetical protein